MANRGSRCSRRRFLQSAATSSLLANAGLLMAERGVLFGRKHLIGTALCNGSPYEGPICRPMKVGKEEIVGILAAFEWSSKRDYKADCKMWEARMQHIVDELAGLSRVRAQIHYRTVGNEIPYLALNWDEGALKLNHQQVG